MGQAHRESVYLVNWVRGRGDEFDRNFGNNVLFK